MLAVCGFALTLIGSCWAVSGAQMEEMGAWSVSGPLSSAAEIAAAIQFANSARPQHTDSGEEENARSTSNRWSQSNHCVTIDFYSANGIEKIGGPDVAPSFVAYTIVDCVDPERDHWLLVGSQGEVEIWCNGIRIGGKRPKKQTLEERFSGSVLLPLKYGSNVIAVAISRCASRFGLSALISSRQQDIVQQLLVGNRSVLQKLVLPSRTIPRFELRGLPDSVDLPLKWVFEELSTGAMVTGKGRSVSGFGALEPLRDGLWRLIVRLGEFDWTEEFLIGAVPKQNTEDRLRPETIPKSLDSTVVFEERLRILTKNRAQNPEERNWQRKLVYTLVKMHAARIAAHESPPKIEIGSLHFSRFRCEIDGSIRCYRYYCPKSFSETTPIVVILPTAMSSFRPFLESVFVSNHLEAEAIAAQAEAAGVAVIWTGYMSQMNGNPMDIAYLQSVVSNFCLTARTGFGRLIAVGNCQAAVTALVAAQQDADSWAGVGLIDPVPHRSVNRNGERAEIQRWPAYWEWLKRRDPLLQMKNMRSVPLWIGFASGGDGHGSRQEANLVRKIAEKSGVTVAFEEIGTSHSQLSAWRAVFEWASRVPPSVKGSGDRVGSRTVAETLAEGFVVVYPDGSEPKIEWLRRANEIQSFWLREYGATIDLVPESSVNTSSACAAKNWILIGDPSYSRWDAIFREFSKNQRVVSARGDSFYCVKVPDLERHGKCVILLGGNSWCDITQWIDLAANGWFDTGVASVSDSGNMRWTFLGFR